MQMLSGLAQCSLGLTARWPPLQGVLLHIHSKSYLQPNLAPSQDISSLAVHSRAPNEKQ
jgi:hypothetical protein